LRRAVQFGRQAQGRAFAEDRYRLVVGKVLEGAVFIIDTAYFDQPRSTGQTTGAIKPEIDGDPHPRRFGPERRLAVGAGLDLPLDRAVDAGLGRRAEGSGALLGRPR